MEDTAGGERSSTASTKDAWTGWGGRRTREGSLRVGGVASCFEVGDALEEGSDGSGWRLLRMIGGILVGIEVGLCMILKLGFLGYVLSFALCHSVPEEYNKRDY